MRYQWEQCPSQNENSLHLRVELPRFFVIDTQDILNLIGLPEKDRQLIRRLVAIPGVVYLRMRRHKIEIGKASIFDWSEIRPPVLDALCERFPLEGEPEEVELVSATTPAPEVAR